MNSKFSFPKSERLTNQKKIAQLFESGESFFVYPFRVLYQQDGESDHPIELAITVPKRNFKKAVQRNLIKRRIREAYRLNRNLLFDQLVDANKNLSLILIYGPKEILESDKIHKSMTRVLKQLGTNLLS